MNILLTGAGGFIGSHLKKMLETEYTVFSPRSKELDLMDKQAVKRYFAEHKIDFIIHSAACGVRIDASATMNDVAKPNFKMFENLADMNVKMIVIGSGAEYDKSKPIVDVKETDFGNSVPQDPYGYSKYLISKEVEKRDNILNLRVFGVYGQGENPTRVTTCIIKHNLQKQSIILNQNVNFSFIYIEDLCNIIIAFTHNFPKEKFINVAHPRVIEIKELAEIVNDISSTKSVINFVKEGLNNEYTANVELLQSLLSDFEFTSYEDGMNEFYNSLKQSTILQ